MRTKYRICWEENGSSHEVEHLFDSYAEAEKYVLESEDIPYGVKKCRTGSYWIEPEPSI